MPGRLLAGGAARSAGASAPRGGDSLGLLGARNLSAHQKTCLSPYTGAVAHLSSAVMPGRLLAGGAARSAGISVLRVGDSLGLLGARNLNAHQKTCLLPHTHAVTHLSSAVMPGRLLAEGAARSAGTSAPRRGDSLGKCTSEHVPVATHACCRAPVICGDAWPAAGRWSCPLCRRICTTRGRISGEMHIRTRACCHTRVLSCTFHLQ